MKGCKLFGGSSTYLIFCGLWRKSGWFVVDGRVVVNNGKISAKKRASD